MTDLAKMMAPIRDTIARTREKMEQIERLLITATEAEEMEWLDAAEGAVEKARRMLAELSGNAGELPADEPRVTGPHEDGDYDIRTSTHWWNGDEWEKRDSQCDKIGFFQRPKKNAVRALPAARRAWVEMRKEAAR